MVGLSQIKISCSNIGFKLLDLTSRSWTAFFAAILFCIIYTVYNTVVPHAFDPYPYILLTLIITLISWLQNIVIMTIQRELTANQEIQEEIQRKQLHYMLTLMEAVKEQIEQNHQIQNSIGHIEKDL